MQGLKKRRAGGKTLIYLVRVVYVPKVNRLFIKNDCTGRHKKRARRERV